MAASSEFLLTNTETVAAGSREALVSSSNPRQRPSGPRLPRHGNGQAEVLSDGSVFLFASPAMRSIREQIEKIAAYDVPVLILGESGTGKEVVARLIHTRSERAKGPFLKVNCAALPASLVESELFGYERGAFTGAMRSSGGKFEFCDSGTILLDEIGEIPPMLQAKLLHVLQDKTYSRLGSHVPIKADVRIIASTNIDIREALGTGALRQDLYYRLNTFVLHLPPLRFRSDEIPFFLEHFAHRFAELYHCPVVRPSRKLIAACLEYPWPGNIRELQSFTKRLLIHGDQNQSIRELQASGQPKAANDFPAVPRKDFSPLDLKRLGREVKCSAERPAIEKILQETRFNRKAAARQLKISYRGLLIKLREYGLDGKTARLGQEDLEMQG